MNVSSVLTKDYENVPPRPRRGYKAKQTQPVVSLPALSLPVVSLSNQSKGRTYFKTGSYAVRSSAPTEAVSSATILASRRSTDSCVSVPSASRNLSESVTLFLPTGIASPLYIPTKQVCSSSAEAFLFTALTISAQRTRSSTINDRSRTIAGNLGMGLAFSSPRCNA